MATLLIAMLDSLLIILAFLGLCFSFGVLYAPHWIDAHIVQEVRNLMFDKDATSFWQYSAALFVILTYFSLFFRLVRRRKASDLFFISAKGNAVQIANQAVTDFIQKIVRSIEGVLNANVKVLCNSKRSKVFLQINLEILEGNAYPEINAKIQDMVKAKLASEMGIEKIGSIAVALKKVQPRETVPVNQ